MMHKTNNSSISAPSSPCAIRGYGRSDDFLGLNSTHRSWKPKDSKLAPSARSRFNSIPRCPPLPSKDINDSLFKASEHSTTSCTSTTSFGNSSHHVQEVVRMLDKDSNVLPPAFQCLEKIGCYGESPEIQPTVPRSDHPVHAVDLIRANVGIPKTTPRRLHIQWPPTAPAYTPRLMEVGKLNPRCPIRNASIRIRWVGLTFSQEDGVEGFFGGCESMKWLSAKIDNCPSRPDVWATPCHEKMHGEETVSVITKPWRVKRVWNVDQIDVHEQEHIVPAVGLMDKVKELLGVNSQDQAEGNIEYDASASHWRFSKVNDLNGEVQQQSRSTAANEEGLLRGIEEVAELNAKWTFEEGGEIEFYDDGDWQAKEFAEEQEQQPTSLKVRNSRVDKKKKDPLCRQTVHSRTPAPPPEEMKTPMRRKAKSFTSKDELLKKEKKNKGKKNNDEEPQSIFDLLAPPPVIFFGGY